MKRIFLILILMMIVDKSSSQHIHGKWLEIIPPGMMLINARQNIYDIGKENMKGYEFNKLYGEQPIKVKDSSLVFADTLAVNFKFLGPNTVLTKSADPSHSGPYMKWVRLFPTKGDIHLLDSPYTGWLEMKLPDEDVRFKLGRQRNIPECILSESISLIAPQEITIEQFGATYFLCIYADEGFLNNLLPIKEINETGMVVYGVPLFDGDVMVNRLEQG